MRFEDLRKEYRAAGFGPADAHRDPIEQFRRWFDDAVDAGIEEPNAMVLATVDASARPTQRHVLLKGLDAEGFVFYTNFTSRKADHLAENPSCALLFPWTEMARQVAIEGPATKVSDGTADEYFASRPRESQLGAWASDQSAVVANREVLEANLAEVTARFSDNEIPRPPHWGGYVVYPRVMEFWQGGLGRLHNRVVYRRDGADWVTERRSP